jgi:hypothetical protein
MKGEAESTRNSIEQTWSFECVLNELIELAANKWGDENEPFT